MTKDRCTRGRAHNWYLAVVKDGLGTYECTKCGGHKWAYAYGYYGQPLADGKYGPLHMGVLGPVQRGQAPATSTPTHTTTKRGKKLTKKEEQERRDRRNEQARKRRRHTKARAEMARLRFGAF